MNQHFNIKILFFTILFFSVNTFSQNINLERMDNEEIEKIIDEKNCFCLYRINTF